MGNRTNDWLEKNTMKVKNDVRSWNIPLIKESIMVSQKYSAAQPFQSWK